MQFSTVSELLSHFFGYKTNWYIVTLFCGGVCHKEFEFNYRCA
jgi:hypothetical protein